MEFKPHEYQKYCIGFVKAHPFCALFLDMGLGKTAIVLAALIDLLFSSLSVKKVLIVAPLRVCDTWKEECEKWDQFQVLKPSMVVGDQKTRIAALNHKAFLYVISRDNIKWLVDYYSRNGVQFDFDCLVLDELSSFKNHQSQRFKYLRKIRPLFRRVIGLTGTPASNSLMDLWAEFALIDRGERLGRFIGRYREAYFRPGAMNPSTGVVYKYIPRPGAEQMIYERISDITVSMKAVDYLDLPECVRINTVVEMDEKERKLYDMLEKDLLIPLDDGDIDAANAAALTGKLLQFSNGAVYDENGVVREIHRHKLEALVDLIEQANGQSVLVSYYYRHDRERIAAYLTAAGIPFREVRDTDSIHDWNAGKIQVGLVQPQSASMGINLQQGGHILILFGMFYSLELYSQLCGRLFRQGQKHTVTIYHIITKDSIDEDVLDALEQKDATQDRLIRALKARIQDAKR